VTFADEHHIRRRTEIMPAYAVFIRDETTNEAELEIYNQKVPATMQGHPLTPLAAYGAHEVLEGPRIEGAVILQFPTLADAKAWYDSPAYRDVREHRFAGATYRAFLIEGLS
jgi:uncharacterized protein (DUF1330 family)